MVRRNGVEDMEKERQYARNEYSFNKDELKKIHQRDCMTFFLVLMGITFIALIFQGIVANPDVNITMFYILGIVLVPDILTDTCGGFYSRCFQ